MMMVIRKRVKKRNRRVIMHKEALYEVQIGLVGNDILV